MPSVLRSPLFAGFESVAAVFSNPHKVAVFLRCDQVGHWAAIGLLWSSLVLPFTWTLCLSIVCCLVSRWAEGVTFKDVEAYKNRDKPGPERRSKEELSAAAIELGLNPNDYDGDEILETEVGAKSLGLTSLGQAVRYYAVYKPKITEMQNCVWAPSCGPYTMPPEDKQTVDIWGKPVGLGEGVVDIPMPTAERAKLITDCVSLTARVMVRQVVWRGVACGGSAAAWARHTGPVVWDIPCSAHPSLDKMCDLYIEMMSQEVVPVGPAWHWLLERPEERYFNHWSRQPLREEDKAMWYAMEKGKPANHETLVFGRQAYIFGKWRLKKSIRHSEVADKMKPLFRELGIEEEKNSGTLTPRVHARVCPPSLCRTRSPPPPRPRKSPPFREAALWRDVACVVWYGVVWWHGHCCYCCLCRPILLPTGRLSYVAH